MMTPEHSGSVAHAVAVGVYFDRLHLFLRQFQITEVNLRWRTGRSPHPDRSYPEAGCGAMTP